MFIELWVIIIAAILFIITGMCIQSVRYDLKDK